MNTPIQASRSSRRGQLGAASLFVALMLLLGGTIIAFFANRGFIFEQRTSANQYRATKAFELAEAGAEWALGKMNEQVMLTTSNSCTPTTTAVGASNTYLERYANPQAAASCAGGVGCFNPPAITAVTSVLSGCRVSATGVTTCECPSAVGPILTTNPEEGRFSVRIGPGGDPSMVEIVSRGCTNGTAACDPAAPYDTSVANFGDSTAVVRVLAKVVPAVPSGPAAALTTGSATVTGGNMHVVNNDQASNGITIHAGTTVNLTGSTNVYSLPGTPPAASVLDNDPSLADLTNSSADAFFANYFGQTLTSYRDADPDVIRLGPNVSGANRCTSAGTCGDRVLAIIASGVRNPRFFVEGSVSFNGGTLGGPSNPIILVVGPLSNGSGGDIELRGGVTAYGLFYSAAATASENWDWTGSGGATIYGAFISRGNFDNASGNMRLIYDPSLWSSAARPIGRLVRVPGSWRDKATTY
jgi:Tfp pilus assembly protein PilX